MLSVRLGFKAPPPVADPSGSGVASTDLMQDLDQAERRLVEAAHVYCRWTDAWGNLPEMNRREPRSREGGQGCSTANKPGQEMADHLLEAVL